MNLPLSRPKIERRSRAIRCVRFFLAFGAALPLVPRAGADANAAGTVPPAFPDAVHVSRGCFISASAYAARFAEAHPEERVTTLTVAPPHFEGPHTIAVLTWRGVWWGRDEYCGVFPLRLPAGAHIAPERLRARAETVLNHVATRQLKAGLIDAGLARGDEMSADERLREITTAATLLPHASRPHWVRCASGEVPFLYFEPSPGRIAMYDPATGTATAECRAADVPALVRQVAMRLGYRVSPVRVARRSRSLD